HHIGLHSFPTRRSSDLLSGKRNPGRKGPLVNTWASMMKKCTNAPLTPGASLMGPARGKRPRQGSQMPAGTMEMHYDYSFPSQRASSLAHASGGAQARLKRDIAASTPSTTQVNAA